MLSTVHPLANCVPSGLSPVTATFFHRLYLSLKSIDLNSPSNPVPVSYMLAAKQQPMVQRHDEERYVQDARREIHRSAEWQPERIEAWELFDRGEHAAKRFRR